MSSQYISKLDSLLEAELAYSKSELQDSTKPNVLLSEQSMLILQMLMEYTDYFKTHKETPANIKSKDRLLRLLSINTDLNGIGDSLQQLKLSNGFILGLNNLLNNRVKELERIVELNNKTFQEL
jgi:hypothetical protein